MKKLNNKYAFIALGFGAAVILFLLFGYTQSIGISSVEEKKDFPQEYKIVSPPIPDELEFAGERVPLENFEVRERIDREFLVNTYWHSATILSIKRANRWFPVIEPILKLYGIPDDFKYLSLIESTLSNAISPAGAVGFWQIIESAGKEYGLEINSEVDERYHVEKSTVAACKYLLDAYKKFGSWTIAAASYNMGMSGISRQLNKQKANNYYNLVLGDETSRYIARILAMKEILKAPKKYGFFIEEIDLYHPLTYKEIIVNTPVNDWADFAKNNNINYKILKYYNPWLRDNILINKSKKSYTVKIPEAGNINVITGSH